MVKSIIRHSPKRLNENDIIDIIENYGTDNDSLRNEYIKHENEVPWLIKIEVIPFEISSKAWE